VMIRLQEVISVILITDLRNQPVGVIKNFKILLVSFYLAGHLPYGIIGVIDKSRRIMINTVQLVAIGLIHIVIIGEGTAFFSLANKALNVSVFIIARNRLPVSLCVCRAETVYTRRSCHRTPNGVGQLLTAVVLIGIGLLFMVACRTVPTRCFQQAAVMVDITGKGLYSC